MLYIIGNHVFKLACGKYWKLKPILIGVMLVCMYSTFPPPCQQRQMASDYNIRNNEHQLHKFLKEWRPGIIIILLSFQNSCQENVQDCIPHKACLEPCCTCARPYTFKPVWWLMPLIPWWQYLLPGQWLLSTWLHIYSLVGYYNEYVCMHAWLNERNLRD